MCYKQTAVCKMLVSFCFPALNNTFTVVTETYTVFNKYRLNSHYNYYLHRIYYLPYFPAHKTPFFPPKSVTSIRPASYAPSVDIVLITLFFSKISNKKFTVRLTGWCALWAGASCGMVRLMGREIW
jgi:hypothetical protein